MMLNTEYQGSVPLLSDKNIFYVLDLKPVTSLGGDFLAAEP